MSVDSQPPVTCPRCGVEAAIPTGYCAACGARLDRSAVSASSNPNPYAAPRQLGPQQVSVSLNDPTMIRRVETVIKDANQVWWALLIGFFCTAVAWLVICPWCLYRLISWYRLSREYPLLMSPAVPKSSMEHRFQRAKIRLIIGSAISLPMSLGLIGVIVFAILREV